MPVADEQRSLGGIAELFAGGTVVGRNCGVGLGSTSTGRAPGTAVRLVRLALLFACSLIEKPACVASIENLDVVPEF
jgi:hypothetical protein